MRKIASVMGALVLSGCAVSGSQLQAQCEAAHPSSFPSMFQCTRDAVVAKKPDAMADARVKLYMLKGEQLAGQVAAGKIADIDARVEWQKTFVEMRAARDAEVMQVLATMPKPAPPSLPSLVPVPVTCTSTPGLAGTVNTTCR